MKKFLLIALVLNVPYFIFAQNPTSVFETESIVYYGIDFSHAHLVGDFGYVSGNDLKTKMFPAWNDIVIQEQDKFDLKTALKKKEVYFDLVPVSKKNSESDPFAILSRKPNHRLSQSMLAEAVSSYEPGSKEEGVGLVFIVEELNRNVDHASIYVTFFDIRTKKILFSEEMVGDPGEAGLRHYWAHAIGSILESIRKYDYKKWKEKYSK
jgi:hypothetical protein